jgi:FlaA1/EpsC-like NDP-sugar epimerase
MMLENKRVLITGGTGSLGKALVRRILTGELGKPKQIIVFSRDEAKQHYMRLEYLGRRSSTDEVIYHNFQQLVTFRIGDVRDFHSVKAAISTADVVFHAAALKQVPTCEYFPSEAVLTNVSGATNLVRAIQESDSTIDTVVGISTDKACKPVNVMGMTKAIQERILVHGNLDCPKTRFICVRYGNVMGSRGSVIPLFREQIRGGGPVTITSPDMTRFLLSLDRAVDTVFAALKEARRGETYVPRIPSAKITDIAEIMIGSRPVKIEYTGVRPGEKVHEILISEEEVYRTVERGKYYSIQPILPELQESSSITPALEREFSSANNLITKTELEQLLKMQPLMIEDQGQYE